jgi:hypothetical protein
MLVSNEIPLGLLVIAGVHTHVHVEKKLIFILQKLDGHAHNYLSNIRLLLSYNVWRVSDIFHCLRSAPLRATNWGIEGWLVRSHSWQVGLRAGIFYSNLTRLGFKINALTKGETRQYCVYKGTTLVCLVGGLGNWPSSGETSKKFPHNSLEINRFIKYVRFILVWVSEDPSCSSWQETHRTFSSYTQGKNKEEIYFSLPLKYNFRIIQKSKFVNNFKPEINISII